MLRTLHLFLARELAKVTLMSLVAFTLVMTVFAIIEPLRKRGLSTDQVLSLFGYTLPAMVSLTLPVAALFAATIVYGRFSQDNEVLACRAGGIGTLTLLEPALVLGVLVTAASLWLSNSVTPYLAGKAETAIKSNIRGIAQYQLRKQGYIRRGGVLLHADRVEPSEDGLILHGVVLLSGKPPKDPNARAATDPNVRSPWDVMMVAADSAAATFQDFQGEAYVRIHMDRPVWTRTSLFNVIREEQAPIDSMPLSTSVKDDPAWYAWDKLVETLKNPAQNMAIQRDLRVVCTDVGHDMLMADIVGTISSGKAYSKLRGKEGNVEISAPHAERHLLEAELSAQTDAAGRRVPVVVRLVGPRDVRTWEAGFCTVDVSRPPLRNTSLVSLALEGDVRVSSAPLAPATSRSAAPAPDWVERETARIGELEMPAEMSQAMERIDPNEVLSNVAEIVTDPAVLRRVRSIVNDDIAHLRGQILAEMHGRLAYGLSCFLMVAMGAALGLLYRGGQLLSAFVISMVPAAIVIIMVLMGKQMLGNPKVAQSYGLGAVWGGIAALLLGDLCLYVHLARK